tara:strand:+ start:67484 stop:69712 length:2229 start_codon:yes stop_codon:yes gene_type:complete
MTTDDNQNRTLGLAGATGVGVGAIVGGGILALAGAAFASTGPAAILAFALNGFIALLTALSFAEMASKFPESGGTYTFSRKVLSVEAAFTVGWVVWFASIVAAVLYALGFAHFAVVMVNDLCVASGQTAPTWLASDWAKPAFAVATTACVTFGLARRAASDGQWANISKVVVFMILILGGLWALSQQPGETTVSTLRPFFHDGWRGLIQAMGYSFIALQGFDLIAAVGGEIKQPAKTIPRAMVLSLVIALVIYLPLLFVITTVGTESGQTIQQAAASDPEGIVAVAASRFLGPVGYWLVVVAALLSMLTALQANVFAASRIAWAMSRDRTLPSPLSKTAQRSGVPVISVCVTATLVVILIGLLPDVAAAGAASSLIFLMTFAIAHWLTILVRARSSLRPPPFQTPWFPFVPVFGALACIGLAIFQGIAVPAAGSIAVIWLGIGGLLFLTLFAHRARLVDASSVAVDPELLTLRGHTPLVLVPIANPDNAGAMIQLADSLVPANVGRVLLQSVVVAPSHWKPSDDPLPLERSQTLMRELITAASRLRIRPETLTTVAAEPMREIARVARLHRCESMLLGLSEIADDRHGSPMESLLSEIDVDVVILRAPPNWHLSDVKRVLVPVAGRGGHDYLLARLLGSLSRKIESPVSFVRVVRKDVTATQLRRANRDLVRLAHDNMRGESEIEVLQSDDAVAAIAERASQCGLIILGVQRIDRNNKLFGDFTRKIAMMTDCPLIVMSRRG